MDPLSIIYLLFATSGIIAADAALNANTVTSRIVVNDTTKRAGMTEDVATEAFTQRLSQIFATKSLLRSSNIRASNDKSFVTHLAEATRLSDLQAGFQDLLGLDPVRVTGVLLEEDGRLVFRALCSGDQVACTVRLPINPGETPMELLRRGALSTAAQLDPYHTAVALLDPEEGEPDSVRARAILEARLNALPKLPLSEKRALVLNLLGIVELLEDKKDAAAERFAAAVAAWPAFRIARLNHAFVDVERDDYHAALAVLSSSIREDSDPRTSATEHVIAGVAYWALGRHDEAAREFQTAVKVHPQNVGAYLYHAEMLDELGAREEATRLRRIGEQNQSGFDNYAELATLYFWMNKNEDQPLKRRKSGVVLQ